MNDRTPFMFRMDALQNDRVRYANQPIALVIAESLEAATEGAVLLEPQYETDTARIGLDAGDSFVPPAVGMGAPAEVRKGDVDAPASRLPPQPSTPPMRRQRSFTTPWSRMPSSPAWDGERLSIDMPSQGLEFARGRAAGLLGIPPEQIHIRSPFLGGGFGGEGLRRRAAAARRSRREDDRTTGQAGAAPRPALRAIRPSSADAPAGAPGRSARRRADGDRPPRPDAHRAPTTTSSSRPPTSRMRSMPVRRSRRHTRRCATMSARQPSCGRRAKQPGSIALESAIDEAAAACGMDPLAFRLRNYAEVEPISGRPFSSKALRDCYAQAAERFGWAGRPVAPRQMRDEAGFLVGWGVGTALFPALMFQAQARAIIKMMEREWSKPARTTWGKARGRRWRRSPPTAWRWTSTRSCSTPATPTCPMPASPADRRTRPRRRSAIHNAGADVIAKLADLAMGDRQSPLYGAGNQSVVARNGPPAPSRRRRPQRELRRHPGARRPVPGRGQRQRRRRPGRAIQLGDVCPWRRCCRGQGRSRSRPGPGDAAGRRLRGRTP